MNTLIIYAHPKMEGHCASMLKHTEKELQERKEKYELIDLYKIKFNPSLNEEELYTSGKKFQSEEVKEIQNKIKNSDKLIFIYPIWWNNCPAILKGFIDKVFTPKFGFVYKKLFGMAYPEGLLKEKKALVLTSSGAYNFIFRFIAGKRGVKIITKDALAFCGIKSKGINYGGARAVTPEVEEKLAKNVRKGINWLY